MSDFGPPRFDVVDALLEFCVQLLPGKIAFALLANEVLDVVAGGGKVAALDLFADEVFDLWLQRHCDLGGFRHSGLSMSSAFQICSL